MKKNLTVHEALQLYEELNVDGESDLDPEWSSDDDESNNHQPYLVLCPPIENPEAITDEDSDEEETGNPDRLPRRLLDAPAEFSKKRSGPLTRVHSKTQGPERSCTDGDNTANHFPIKISNSKRNHKISQTNVEGSTPIEVGARMIAAEEDSTPIRTSTRKRVLPMKFESDKSCGSKTHRIDWYNISEK